MHRPISTPIITMDPHSQSEARRRSGRQRSDHHNPSAKSATEASAIDQANTGNQDSGKAKKKKQSGGCGAAPKG